MLTIALDTCVIDEDVARGHASLRSGHDRHHGHAARRADNIIVPAKPYTRHTLGVAVAGAPGEPQSRVTFSLDVARPAIEIRLVPPTAQFAVVALTSTWHAACLLR